MKKQQEQSSSVNKMTQRRSFKVVVLLPRLARARLRHSDTKGANRGSYHRGYFGDVMPLSAAFAHCRTDLKGFKRKMGNSIIHLPEPPPRHFVLRDSLLWFGFCCFVFTDVESKTAEWSFFSHGVFYQYMVSNTGNFAGGESKKQLGKKKMFPITGVLYLARGTDTLTPASLQQAQFITI